MKIALNDPYSMPTFTDSEWGGMTYEDYPEEIEVRKIEDYTIFLANGKFLQLRPSEYKIMVDKKECFLDRVEDIVSDLCYYGRIADKELSREDVKELLESGKVTVADIANRITEVLKTNFKLPQ